MKTNPWIATAMQLPSRFYEVEAMEPDGKIHEHLVYIDSDHDSDQEATLLWQSSHWTHGGEVSDIFPYWRMPRTVADEVAERENGEIK